MPVSLMYPSVPGGSQCPSWIPVSLGDPVSLVDLVSLGDPVSLVDPGVPGGPPVIRLSVMELIMLEILRQRRKGKLLLGRRLLAKTPEQQTKSCTNKSWSKSSTDHREEMPRRLRQLFTVGPIWGTVPRRHDFTGAPSLSCAQHSSKRVCQGQGLNLWDLLEGLALRLPS
ncbi:E3 Ubiquitin-Protein Ligase Trim36 [Manis pentadactyla]|nr:E3 Ubiquitin-Protein Ligase Trim36 [Manis pentadactyla]